MFFTSWYIPKRISALQDVLGCEVCRKRMWHQTLVFESKGVAVGEEILFLSPHAMHFFIA